MHGLLDPDLEGRVLAPRMCFRSQMGYGVHLDWILYQGCTMLGEGAGGSTSGTGAVLAERIPRLTSSIRSGARERR